MAGDLPTPDKLRAAIFLHAACETAAEAFYDEDDLDDLPLALKAQELRVLAAEFLARAGRILNGRPSGVPA